MSLIDAFGSDATCPLCGSAGAKKILFFVSCPNRSCPNGGGAVARPKAGAGPAEPRKPRPVPMRADWPDVSFNPANATLQIRYKNYAAEDKTFSADPRSIARKRAHVSVRVAPTGKRIALDRSRILNGDAVDQAVQANPRPTSKEERILKYHRSHGTTSPACEDLRKKYPNWI